MIINKKQRVKLDLLKAFAEEAKNKPKPKKVKEVKSIEEKFEEDK